MAIKLCHHIKEDGIWCRSAALHGRDYCYAHLTFRGRRMRAAQQRAQAGAWRLELPPLEDLNAVQVAIMQVLDAITGDRIERHAAGHLLYGLQTAASNLRGKDHVSFEVAPSAENRCVSYDSFEEDFELTSGDTVAVAADSSAEPPGLNATSSPTDSGQGGAAADEKIAVERADGAAPCPIIIEKIHAVADDDPMQDSFLNLEIGSAPSEAGVREAPRKPPRGLRPPNAQRQSAEEAAALAKELVATAEECGRLEGEVRKCRDCEVKVWKRLAQFWEGLSHPPDWLPTSGTMDCDDCTYRHLTTLGRHLHEPMPALFNIYFEATRDGGADRCDFDDYLYAVSDALNRSDKLPNDWRGLMEFLGLAKTPQNVAGEDAKATENEDVSA